MIGGFKTGNLAMSGYGWVNKIAMIGYTLLFDYESPRRYQGRINAGPGLYSLTHHSYKN